MARAIKHIAVIMAGGAGERFWPQTSSRLPKYAMTFDGQTSFLQETVNRIEPVYGKKNILIVTGKDHARLVRKLLPNFSASQILAEPERKNTGLATILSTAFIKRKYGEEATASFFPADALIKNKKKFQSILGKSLTSSVREQKIVVLGIRPTRPATGYGYIQYKERNRESEACKVKRFVEKPNLKKAKMYFKRQDFAWNAGIFIWPVKTLFQELKKHCPKHHSAFLPLSRGSWTDLRLRTLFRKFDPISIDKLLIEKVKELNLFKADVGWDDIGSWEALRRMNADANGNLFIGSCASRDVRNCVVQMKGSKRVVVSGVENLIIVENDNQVLICDRSEAEDVKNLKSLGL